VTGFRLGVNYWPSASAMAMWARFDAVAVARDFARIAELGLVDVRFFVRWSDFAPTETSVDPRAVERFVTVLDLARDAGLRAMPTLFCGHMSGVNWIPDWALDPERPAGRFRTFVGDGPGAERAAGQRDAYVGAMLAPQLLLARTLGAAARSHPALDAWDLGNEFSNVGEPASPGDAAAWSAALCAELEAASGARATGGLHGEDVERDRGIRPSSIAAPWPYATMHGYPAYSAFARSVDDPEVAPYLCELVAGFAGKPVLFSELGNPACPPGAPSGDRCLDEPAMATYASAVLDRLQRRGALGGWWWCWTDYAPELATVAPFDRAPHELRFGIVRADGTPKPVAATLAAFAAERRPVVPRGPALADETTFYAALPGALGAGFARYLRERDAG